MTYPFQAKTSITILIIGLSLLISCSEQATAGSTSNSSSQVSSSSATKLSYVKSSEDKTDYNKASEDKGDYDIEKYSCTNTDHPGYTILKEKDATREYIVHVPSSYDPTNPAGLVINYHGYGGCAAYFMEQVGDLNEIADKENFIVVYPQAKVGSKGDAYWDAGYIEASSIDESDVYFTETLLSQLKQDFQIDSTSIYATGYSNGGMMAYGLACSRKDLFAAVGIMSGIMLPATCTNPEPTSIIHFHGSNDWVLPLGGNENYQSVEKVINFWLDHNGMTSAKVVSTDLNQGDVLGEAYQLEEDDVSIILYTIKKEFGKPGEHVWFTSPIANESPNQILWDFLSSHQLKI
jgi:polyhydroxybutyrate depolymerase